MNYKNQIKSLISGILANNDEQVNNITTTLSESIMLDKDDAIKGAIIESLNGDDHAKNL